MLHNADILYLYEAKDTNPNGDPDAENRPRMDYVGRRLLVSDVRLISAMCGTISLPGGRMFGCGPKRMGAARTRMAG